MQTEYLSPAIDDLKMQRNKENNQKSPAKHPFFDFRRQSRWVNDQSMTDEQEKKYWKLAHTDKEAAGAYREKCEKENRTPEFSAYLKAGRFENGDDDLI